MFFDRISTKYGGALKITFEDKEEFEFFLNFLEEVNKESKDCNFANSDIDSLIFNLNKNIKISEDGSITVILFNDKISEVFSVFMSMMKLLCVERNRYSKLADEHIELQKEFLEMVKDYNKHLELLVNNK